MNFILTITIYPAIVIVHEKYINPLWKKISTPLFKLCKRKKEEEDTDELPEDKQPEKKKEKQRFLEWFFGNPWNWTVDKLKIPIIIVFGIYAVFSGWRASELSPLTETEKWFGDGHYLQRAWEMIQDKYVAGDYDRAIKVKFMYGFDGLSKDGIGLWDVDDRGQLEFDQQWDLTTATNQ